MKRSLKSILKDIFTRYYTTEVSYSDGCGKMTVYYAVPLKWFKKNWGVSDLQLWKQAIDDNVAIICEVKHY